MTPAVKLLKKLGTEFQIHQYVHDPSWGSYGEEAAVKIGVDPERVYKTLVAQLDDSTLIVSIVPVSESLNLKVLAKWCKAKKANMAEKNLVEKSTGYLVGGVSPLAQKKKLKTFIDSSAKNLDTIFISGGKRGLDIELTPQLLAKLTSAEFVPLSR